MNILDKEYKLKQNTIMISETDTKGIITYVNNAFCEASGYTKEELIGKPHNMIRHPSMPKGLFERIWFNLKASKAWSGAIKNLRKDGSYFWVDAEIVPINDENKVTQYYVAAYRALSEKNRDEAETMYEQERVRENFKGEGAL